MITLRKLRSLPEGTRLRKIHRLIHSFELSIRKGESWDRGYLAHLIPLLVEEVDSGHLRGAAELRLEAVALTELLPAGREELILRRLNTVRHRLGGTLGVAPGDWDFEPTREESGDRRFFEIALYLEDLRSPFNLGSIARSAEAFGAAGLLLSPPVPSIDHPRARRTAMGALQALPCRRAPLPSAALSPAPEVPVFALESGGTAIGEFSFPSHGVCLLGSEELGLSAEALELADRSAGRCTIPLYGGKGSLNVAVATGILLSYWTAAILGGEKKGPAGDRRSLFDSIVTEWERATARSRE